MDLMRGCSLDKLHQRLALAKLALQVPLHLPVVIAAQSHRLLTSYRYHTRNRSTKKKTQNKSETQNKKNNMKTAARYGRSYIQHHSTVHISDTSRSAADHLDAISAYSRSSRCYLCRHEMLCKDLYSTDPTREKRPWHKRSHPASVAYSRSLRSYRSYRPYSSWMDLP